MKQKHISEILGIHQSDISRFINGKKPLSWNLSEKLSKIFPGKTISEWKRSTPTELKEVFNQLKKEKETE